MCFAPKVPKPPAPPPAPTRQSAELEAEDTRRRLLARMGYQATIKTSAAGARDYGRNSQYTGLSAGSRQTLGAG